MQASTPSFSFGQTPTQSQSNASSFSFGQSQQTPAFQFGQTASTNEPQSQNAAPSPTSNIFSKPAGQPSFGAQGSQQNSNAFGNMFAKPAESTSPIVQNTPSIFAPNSVPPASSSASFTFGQNSTPSFAFGQKAPEPAAPATATSFSFGQKAPEAPTPPISQSFTFGQSKADAPASTNASPFSFSQPAAPIVASAFTHGQKPAESPAPSKSTSFSFGIKPADAAAPPSPSLFNFGSKASDTPAEPSKSPFNFGTKPADSAVPSAPPSISGLSQNTSSLFNFQPKPAEKAESSLPPSSSAPNNIFQKSTEKTEEAPAPHPIQGPSSFQKPVAAPAGNNSLFDPSSSSSMFQNTTAMPFSGMSSPKPKDGPTANIFAQANEPQPIIIGSLIDNNSLSSNIFAQAQAEVAKQAPPPTPKPAPKTITNGAANGDTVLQSIETAPAPRTNGIPPPRRQLFTKMEEMANYQRDRIDALCPPRFNDTQKIEFYGLYRIRRLNEAFKSYTTDVLGPTDSFMDAIKFYMQTCDLIAKECDEKRAALKRKAGNEESLNDSQAKRQKPNGFANDIDNSPQPSPERRTRPTTTKNVFTSPKKTTPPLDNSTTPKAAPPTSSLFASNPDTTQKQPVSMATSPFKVNGVTAAPLLPTPSAALSTSSPKGKRKAEVQLTKDDPTGEERDSRDKRQQARPNGSSSTMNRFKSILDTPENSKSDDRTPAKPNPFAALPVPSSASKAQETPARPNPFAALSVPSTAPPAAGSKFTAPSNSSSTFQTTASNLFGSKSTTSSEQSPKPLFGAAASSQSQPVATSTPATATPSSNMFAQSSSGATGATSTIKPPNFGTPVNFLAQFGAKAEKDKATAEEKAMQRAKDEDMDSDDDEAEWEAKYKAKREEEKRALEEAASKRAKFIPGKGFSFGSDAEATNEPPPETTVSPSLKPLFGQPAAGATSNTFGSSSTSAPKSNNIFGQTSSTSGSAPTQSIFAPISKPATNSNIFGQSNPGASSLFLPPNRSETSSPAAGSSTGSVFDSQEIKKPVTFGNIFGQASDASNADDDESTDGDDENEDQENTDPNEEKKDPTYNPHKDKSSGPGTPVEETGPGIASTKKSSNLFSFAPSGTTTPNKAGTGTFGTNSSASGSSTPGGLFDRIAKDGNGNPIRKVSSEDKENSGPASNSIFGASSIFSTSTSGNNPFASLGKTPTAQSGSPGDKTWNQNTPIKFGMSTTGPPATPSLNVTAATPEKPADKPSPFAGLFGGAGTVTPKPSLFAGLNADKPAGAVGFNFGGAGSTVASSLLPSAVASGVTSRATTPGGTTDGESASEANDPDAEHHEQVDLLSTAAGEEDEEVMFTVRTKAMKFIPAKDGEGSSWVTKGLGPLKVLKHKTSGAGRVLLRADPSGTIVLNKSILSKMDYAATKKTVKLLTADESGKGLETWLLQVKTEEVATDLAEALEQNKGKA